MARLSTVEQHPDRTLIDGELRNGVACTVVAKDYGLSRQAVSRHKHRHITKPAQESGTGQESESDKVRSQLRALYNAATGALLAAKTAGDSRAQLAALKEARACLRLLADKMPSEGTGIGNGADPDAPPAHELYGAVMRGLDGHPAAKASVVSSLARLEEEWRTRDHP